MAGIKDIASLWNNVREIDLRPIRETALQTVKIALVGGLGVGRRTLAAQMRSDPLRPHVQTQSPLLICDLESLEGTNIADLIIIILDVTLENYNREQELASKWSNSGKKVLVFYNKMDTLASGELLDAGLNRQLLATPALKILYGSALDRKYLLQEFVPAVLELLPNQHLALGRQFPLFRVPIAHEIINETCFSNAAYSISTSLAETVPILDIPLNITDMVVLTKTQAFMAYKLGLTLGFSTRWQDYVAEFGSVIGSGFLWRQAARQLVGLVPVWGIVPKVTISYAGTYAVGHTILQWYLTGKHLTRQQARQLYVDAFNRGKVLARGLIDKIPRPRLGRSKKGETAQLPAPTEGQPSNAVVQPTQKGKTKRSAPPKKFSPFGKRQQPKVCPNCAKPNAADARFCQYCGQTLAPPPEPSK